MFSAASPSSLWIIKPGSLGDIVHTLPCMAAIRSQWPQTQITWVVDSRWAPLLEDNPHIDRCLLFDRQNFRGWDGFRKALRWMGSLKSYGQPQVCIDLQGLFRSALIARLSGCQNIIGISDAREGARLLYHQTATLPAGELHAVDRYLSVLPLLNIARPSQVQFPLPIGSKPLGVSLPPDWILLHPFARGEGKSLDEIAIVRFCKKFQHLPILIAGMGKISSRLPSHCRILLNQTALPEMVWLCRNARFVVSVDSGPSHIAAATSPARLLALHMCTDPRLVGPYSSEAWIWQGGDIRQQNLSSRVPILPYRSLELPDIDHIATWLTSQLGDCRQIKCMGN